MKRLKIFLLSMVLFSCGAYAAQNDKAPDSNSPKSSNNQETSTADNKKPDSKVKETSKKESTTEDKKEDSKKEDIKENSDKEKKEDSKKEEPIETAQTSISEDCKKNYPALSLGIDFKQTWIPGRGGWAPIMPRCFSGGGIYAAVKYLEFSAIEIGIERTEKRTRNHFLAGNTFIFGIPVPHSGIPTSISAHIRETYIDFQALWPFEDYCLEFLAAIGVGFVKANLHGLLQPPFSVLEQGIESIRIKTKGVLRLNIALKYLIADWVGVRARFGWENTSSLRLKRNYGFDPILALGASRKPYNDTLSLGLGLFVQFK